MHFNLSQCLRVLLLSPIVLLSPLAGQMDFDQNKPFRFSSTLSAQLEGGGTKDYSRLRAQLWDHAARQVLAEAHVSMVGSFDMHGVPAGVFMLRIVDMQGELVHMENVSLPNNGTVMVKLPGGQLPSAGRPVSLARLQHKVPKKAMKAFKHGHEALAAGKREQAQLLFEEATRLDPQFFEAANDLGVLYLGDKRLSEAYEMFRRATVIDDTDPKAESNLAFVLLALRRYPEAEEAARSSVRADSLSSQARYLLAVSLLEQRKSPKEVLFHLGKAQEQFEPARRLLKKLKGQGLASAQ